MAVVKLPCHVGALVCGCGCAIVVDNPDHLEHTSEDVAAFIKEGLIVARFEHDDAIAAFSRKCENYPHEPWQQRMEDARQQRAQKKLAL